MLVTPKQRSTDGGEDVKMVVQSQDANGRELLCQTITEYDWTFLYRIDTCEEMTQAFYSTVTGLDDYCLPLRTVRRYSTDKPCVSDQFRHLIRCRQHAPKTGQTARYRVYRNRVQRMSRTLRRKYYARKIKGLRVSNPRNCWRSVKMMTRQTINTSQPLNGLANQLHDGDVQALADNINRFFQGVAADLNPQDDNSTPPPSEVSRTSS